MRKTSIRKTIAVTFIAAAVLSMAACGNINAGPGDSAEAVANMDGSTEPEATAEPTAEPDASQSSAETKESSATDKSVTESRVGTDQSVDDQEAEKAAAEKAAKAEADRKAAEEAAAKAEAERKAAEAARAEAERKAAEEAARNQQNQTGNQAGNTQNGSQSNGTADVTGNATSGSTPAEVPANTPAPTPEPTPVHQHEWTPVYETRTVTVVVQEEWFEPEYADIPIVESHCVCDQCGADFGSGKEGNAAAYDHITRDLSGCTSYHGVDVTVGYDHVDLGSVIPHPAVTEERTEQVLVGYTCGCGATK